MLAAQLALETVFAQTLIVVGSLLAEEALEERLQPEIEGRTPCSGCEEDDSCWGTE